MTAIDMKKLQSKDHRLYRLMTASEDWRQFYTKRIGLFGNFEGAIIFPEIILGISNNIYIVKFDKEKTLINFKVIVQTTPQLVLTKNYTYFKTIEEVYQHEKNVRIEKDPIGIDKDSTGILISGNKIRFEETTAIFTNKRSMNKFVNSKFKEALNQLF